MELLFQYETRPTSSDAQTRMNDETGEMGEVVEQGGGDDEAVEDGGVPAAADVIEEDSRISPWNRQMVVRCVTP
ncbi:hypothetical protein JTB14_003749 [Gonioctena quinquepunctata]|nr:hypothetical protein JTB14_003749 [Gonioctena quinquepunctata]